MFYSCFFAFGIGWNVAPFFLSRECSKYRRFLSWFGIGSANWDQQKKNNN